MVNAHKHWQPDGHGIVDLHLPVQINDFDLMKKTTAFQVPKFIELRP